MLGLRSLVAAVLLACSILIPVSAGEAAVVAGRDPLVEAIARAAGQAKAERYAPLVRAAARKHGVPELLVVGIIKQESDWDPTCRTGPSRGLMQVNRGHARRGDDLFDPKTNLEYGCRILREYRDWAANRMPKGATDREIWHKALTAYNFGPVAVAHRGLFRSRYSAKVLRGYEQAERLR
ncbi:MAG: lytic transglycosylase domain-containing protein [Candidatus Sericytochromatia bacterium]|nr:lytic transglycosylase domain-containing protein [Candidatus Sericytochromatia bacterium]